MSSSSSGTKLGVSADDGEDPSASAVPEPIGIANEASAPIPLFGSLEGSKVGPYRILSRVGEGGMGMVYLAEHEIIGRKAAIKVLNEEVSGDEEAVSRFFTEARAVNQIRHPNIVEVTDFGSADGRHYIVMEYLEGETLADRLDRVGVFDPMSTVHIGRQVASALGAAHGLGMVHRDMKPANIFLRDHPDYPDFVKVLDFGIAKLLSPDAVVGHQTRVGALIGTPAYMSPEQCLGDASLDHRSDIYSLGVVLYVMLTGRLPFKDAALGQMIMAHVTETPRAPSELNRRVPHELSRVVMRALAKRKEDRHASMKELRQALEAVVGYPRTPTPMAVPLLIAPSEGSGPIAVVPPERDGAPTMMSRPSTVAQMGAALARPGALAAKDEGLVDKLIAIVRERVAQQKLDLPALSPTTERCLERLEQRGISFAQLAAVAGQDRALASRIVRLANSAVFPSLAPAISLEQAIGRLGELGLRQALYEFEARPVLESGGERVREALRRPWYHAMATALVLEKLVLASREGEPDLVAPWLAAVVHDVGKMVVARFLLSVERQTAGTRGPRWMHEEMWLRAMAATHRPVGLAIARAWHLPAATIRAVEACDAYERGAGRTDGNLLRFAEAVANRDGYYLRRTDADAADLVLAEGRVELGIDERTEGKAIGGWKDRLLTMVHARGA